MWLRPRTEMLPLNSRWWEYADDTQDCVLATLWGALNLLFLAAAVMGLIRGPRPQYLALMLLFVAAALGVPGNHRKSRAALHPGVLSGRAAARRSVDFGLEALADGPSCSPRDARAEVVDQPRRPYPGRDCHQCTARYRLNRLQCVRIDNRKVIKLGAGFRGNRPRANVGQLLGVALAGIESPPSPAAENGSAPAPAGAVLH